MYIGDGDSDRRERLHNGRSHPDRASPLSVAIPVWVIKCETKKRGSVFGPLKSHLTANISKTVSRSVTCQLEPSSTSYLKM